MRRFREFAVGAVAMVAIAAFFSVVPWLLWRVAGWPLPSALPSWDEFTTTLTSGNIADSTLIKALALIIWITWAQLSVILLAEIAAQVRGLSVRRVGPSGLHAFAGRWVAQAALVLTALSNATPAVAAPLPVFAVDTAPADQITRTPGAVIDLRSGPVEIGRVTTPTATIVHVASHRDTWLSLAEQYLGDANAWRDLHALNAGRAQPDGTTIGKPGVIRSGWRLLVPTTQTPAAVRIAALATSSGQALDPAELMSAIDTADPTVITVARGDHLWGLAESALAESWGRAPTDAETLAYWARILDANPDLPSGDPDLIHPGDSVTLPAIETELPLDAELPVKTEPRIAEAAPTIDRDADAVAPTTTDAAPSNTTDAAPTTTDAAPSNTTDAAPTTTDAAPSNTTEVAPTTTDAAPSNTTDAAPTTTDAAPTTTDAAPALDGDADAAPADAGPSGDDDSGDRRLLTESLGRTALGLGGIAVAGGLLFNIRRRRRATMIRRPAGHALVGPPPAGEHLETVAVAATATNEYDVDQDPVARALSALAPTQPEPYVLHPHPLLLHRFERSVSILLDLPVSEIAEQFSTDESGRRVSIGLAEAASLPPVPAVPASPGWVTVGVATGPDEGTVQLNLEAIGTLNVSGDDPIGIVSSMILEMTSGPGAHQVLLLTDEAADLPAADAFGDATRVDAADGWHQLDEWMASVDRHLETTGFTSAFAARAAGTDDPWPVLVAITTQAPPPELTARLSRGGRAVALIGLDALPDARTHIHADGDRVQILPFGLDLAAQRVSTDSVVGLADLWSAALADPVPLPLFGPDTGPATAPEPSPAAEVFEHHTGQQALLAVGSDPDRESPVMVRLLGPVDVEGSKEPMKGQQAAVLAFLATRDRRSATADQVRDSIWSGQRISTGRLHSVTSAIRQRLPAGSALPPAESSVYRVNGITTDLALFQSLVTDAQDRDLEEMIPRLQDALDLVRGVPFTVTAAHDQWWRWVDVEMLRTATEALVADVAHRLALIGLDNNDPQLALRAAGQGLLASPHAEILVEDLMRAHCRAGQRTIAIAVLDAHEAALVDLGLEVDDALRIVLQEETAVGG